MVDTVRQHEIVDGVCKHCNASEPMLERTCISRDSRSGEDRPEPTERRYAIFDQDTISKRLAELKAERDAAMNQPTNETTPASQEQTGC